MSEHNNDRSKAIIGTHGFSAGKKGGYLYRTFSVGVFPWVAGKNSPRRGAALVRVSGSVSEPEAVYARAREIAAALDAGTYSGPKRVDV